MSRYIKFEDRFKARAAAHRESLERGERHRVYPTGWGIQEDGMIEVPDGEAIRSRISENLSSTPALALANPLGRNRVEPLTPETPTGRP